MPVTFDILKPHGLVYVRYWGHVKVADSIETFREFEKHPDNKPGLKQLVDLSAVESIERDYTKVMEMQARKADVFMGNKSQTLIVYYATSPVAITMSRLIVRSWEPFPWVIPRVVESETNAMDVLGFSGQTIEGLLQVSS